MKGMSLIELVVVTALIMILAGGGGVALNTFNEKQKVVAAKDELVASLRLARNAARTAKGPVGGEITQVTVTVSSEGVVLATGNPGAITYVNKDITSKGVSLSGLAGPISFSAYKASTGGNYQIEVTSDTGATARVVIDSNGLIDGQ